MLWSREPLISDCTPLGAELAFDKSVGSGLDMTMGHPAPSAVKSVNNGALGVSAHLSTIGLFRFGTLLSIRLHAGRQANGARDRDQTGGSQSPSASGTITKCQDQPFDG